MPKTISYIFAIFAGAALCWSVFSTPAVSADETTQTSKNKWEYCSLALEPARTQNMGKLTARVTILYARGNGTVSEMVELTGADDDKLDAELLGKAMTKLGNDGWEMVTQGIKLQTRGNEGHALYFKRPVS